MTAWVAMVAWQSSDLSRSGRQCGIRGKDIVCVVRKRKMWFMSTTRACADMPLLLDTENLMLPDLRTNETLPALPDAWI